MPYIIRPFVETFGIRAASTFLNPRHMIAQSTITKMM